MESILGQYDDYKFNTTRQVLQLLFRVRIFSFIKFKTNLNDCQEAQLEQNQRGEHLVLRERVEQGKGELEEMAKRFFLHSTQALPVFLKENRVVAR